MMYNITAKYGNHSVVYGACSPYTDHRSGLNASMVARIYYFSYIYFTANFIHCQ